MALRLETLTIDAADPPTLGQFWAAVFRVGEPTPGADGDVELQIPGGENQ